MSEYPRKNSDGETVWACCESSIGPVCAHRAFKAEAAAADADYQAFKKQIASMSPDLAHVLFESPICSEHEVPVSQCGCP